MSFLLSYPDAVQFHRNGLWTDAQSTPEGFGVEKTLLTCAENSHGLVLTLRSDCPVSYIKVRWERPLPEKCRLFSDALERAYGDLGWHTLDPFRQMMWYCLATNGEVTEGFGVMVCPAAISFWQADQSGLTLWLDVRCGGNPVELGDRALEVCTVVSAAAAPDESPFRFAKRFCGLLSPNPLRPSYHLYGANTWLYTYGYHYSDICRESVINDSKFYSDLAGSCENRPALVLDDGWNEHCPSFGNAPGGPHYRGNERFPHMDTLAEAVRKEGCRPGIWMRLLMTFQEGLAPEMLLQRPGSERVLDPSHPESRRIIREDVARVCGWGFEILKHDFSTYELFGKMGLQMDWQFTAPGWSFYDKSRTTAEIVTDFYRTVKEGAGDTAVIGCNCIGHLGAGLMEYNRIGDDTSSYVWDRTRKYGINSLAFRLCQHETFFEVDADCVGHREEYVPWEYTAQWMDLLARSNTPLLLSVDPAELSSSDRKAAVRAAFERNRSRQDCLEPVDWIYTTCPEQWLSNGDPIRYRFSLPTGIRHFGSLTQFDMN
ncbi:MAG: alpha-galactosidase [Oscillospiraceae bacterium]|nr:alpha-galactosidase [Oscillospiraceae bacterium]